MNAVAYIPWNRLSWSINYVSRLRRIQFDAQKEFYCSDPRELEEIILNLSLSRIMALALFCNDGSTNNGRYR